MDCMRNDDEDSCPFPIYNSTVLFNYCFPEVESTADTVRTVSQSMQEDKPDPMTVLLMDMQKGWSVFIYMTIISMLITMTYVFLLKYIAKPLLYVSLVLVVLCLAGGAGFSTVQYLDVSKLESTNPE
jgi:hypothetical protein